MNDSQPILGALDPVSLPSPMSWLEAHGLKVLGILIGMVLFYQMVVLTSRRIARLVARGEGHTRHDDKDSRAETLAGVFRYTAALVVFILGGLMILEEIGVPIVTLLGGVAVIGLAISFGTQNLIKDYFTGFMILLEDQYSVGDVVEINKIGGVVERITLRITVLRDQAGAAHFIPHGSIVSVSNMTHGWARAVWSIHVGYKENPDRVMQVLRELCQELREDERFAPFILEEPQMQGVDELGDSGYVVKFFLKTKPFKQWEVRRELLRRITLRSDELGITVHDEEAGPEVNP